MKKKPLAVTACLLVAFASAQGQFSLSGRVSFDGKPAKNALVTLLPDSLRKTCDENGFFVFAPLPAGSYAVWVSLEGYDDYRETVEITHKNRWIAVRFARVNDAGDSAELYRAIERTRRGRHYFNPPGGNLPAA